MQNQWFYADGLFIVDVWMLAALIAAVFWSRRRQTVRPARIALAAVTVYIALNLAVTTLGRREVLSRYPGHNVHGGSGGSRPLAA